MSVRSFSSSFWDTFSEKYVELTQRIETTKELLLHMQDSGLLTEEQRKAIESKSTCDAMLSLPEVGNDRKLSLFFEALAATNQRHVVDYILGFETESTEFVPRRQRAEKEADEQQIARIPRPVLETILLKAIGMKQPSVWRKSKPLESHWKYTKRLIAVISVCYEWFTTVTCRHYNKDRLRRVINLRVNRSSIPIASNFYYLRDYCRQLFEPDYGLLDLLVSGNLLPQEQKETIENKETVEERNKWLLDYVWDQKFQNWSKKCPGFIAALRRTSQQHIVNITSHPSALRYARSITDSETMKTAFGDIRPLSANHRSRLDFNCASLAEAIDSSHGLIGELREAKCITSRQMQSIDNCQGQTEKNKKLLDILKRRRVRDFKMFIKCLKKTNQGTLVTALCHDGVVVAVHATIQHAEAGCDVAETCTCIIKQYESHTMDELQNIFNELNQLLGSDVTLIRLKEDNGIRAFFHCKTVMGLHRFDEVCITQQLTTTLQETFNEFVPQNPKSQVSVLRWKANDYTRCVRYFHKELGVLRDIYGLVPCEEREAHCDFCPSEQFLADTILLIVIIKSAGLLLRVFDGLGSKRSDILTWMIVGAVCRSWWNIIRTHPMKSRLDRRYDYVCLPYRRHPQLVKQLRTASAVEGVTQLDDKIFVVCWSSGTIRVFGPNYEQLEDIDVKGLRQPQDIAACSETRSLYIADCWDWGSLGCVWRVSTDGHAERFLPSQTNFHPQSLSVTSRRLLVTLMCGELLLYGADGLELKRLSFRGMLSDLTHAVETSRGTFVFCHITPQPQVCEVDIDGRTISVFSNQQQLTWPYHMSFDSEGRLFIGDCDKQHILLLTSDLHLDRVLLDSEHHQLVEQPFRLFFSQQTRQLIVGGKQSFAVQVFAVS